MKNPTIVFQKPKSVIIEEREVPRVKGDEVLIRTERSLVSIGTELYHFKRRVSSSIILGKLRQIPVYPGL